LYNLLRDKSIALKDLDFLEDKNFIDLAEDAKFKMLAQLEADVSFLAQNEINDYSLLIGVHDVTHNSPINYESLKGGIYSKDKKKLYFIGIIDTLTEYG